MCRIRGWYELFFCVWSRYLWLSAMLSVRPVALPLTWDRESDDTIHGYSGENEAFLSFCVGLYQLIHLLTLLESFCVISKLR